MEVELPTSLCTGPYSVASRFVSQPLGMPQQNSVGAWAAAVRLIYVGSLSFRPLVAYVIPPRDADEQLRKVPWAVLGLEITTKLLFPNSCGADKLRRNVASKVAHSACSGREFDV